MTKYKFANKNQYLVSITLCLILWPFSKAKVTFIENHMQWIHQVLRASTMKLQIKKLEQRENNLLYSAIL